MYGDAFSYFEGYTNFNSVTIIDEDLMLKNWNFLLDSWWPHNNFTFWLIAYWKWRYGIKGTWAERGWETSCDGNAHSYLSQESEFYATKFT